MVRAVSYSILANVIMHQLTATEVFMVLKSLLVLPKSKLRLNAAKLLSSRMQQTELGTFA